MNSTASGTTPYRPTNNLLEALIYPQALSCQVAEHCWDPVGHAIATYGYLFNGLILARQREV